MLVWVVPRATIGKLTISNPREMSPEPLDSVGDPRIAALHVAVEFNQPTGKLSFATCRNIRGSIRPTDSCKARKPA